LTIILSAELTKTHYFRMFFFWRMGIVNQIICIETIFSFLIVNSDLGESTCSLNSIFVIFCKHHLPKKHKLH